MENQKIISLNELDFLNACGIIRFGRCAEKN